MNIIFKNHTTTVNFNSFLSPLSIFVGLFAVAHVYRVCRGGRQPRRKTMEYLDVADLKKLLHNKQITFPHFLKWSFEAGRRVEQGSDEEVEFMGGRSTTIHTVLQ